MPSPPPAPNSLCGRCGKGPGAFLTLAEAATCLSVPIDTMRRWAYRLGAFPLYYVGVSRHARLVRVLHADVQPMLQPPDPAEASMKVMLAAWHPDLRAEWGPRGQPKELITEADVVSSIPLKEAAGRLGVSYGTVYSHLTRHHLPELRAFILDGLGLRRSVRIPLDAIEAARPVLERVLAEAAPRAARAAAGKARLAAEQQQLQERRRQKREERLTGGQ